MTSGTCLYPPHEVRGVMHRLVAGPCIFHERLATKNHRRAATVFSHLLGYRAIGWAAGGGSGTSGSARSRSPPVAAAAGTLWPWPGPPGRRRSRGRGRPTTRRSRPRSATPRAGGRARGWCSGPRRSLCGRLREGSEAPLASRAFGSDSSKEVTSRTRNP